MDLHGRVLLLLLSTLSAFGGNVTEDGSLDKIGKTMTVFNVVKFPNDPCTATTGYNGTCYTATECKTLGGSATGSCASSFGVCCVFTLSCGQTSSQNNTYIDQTTYTIGTDPSLCTYKICPFGSVSKIKLDFKTLVIAAPAGDTDLGKVVEGSPFYTGHCLEDTLNIVSPGHASPPEICGYNSGQHMFVPMSDQCVSINLNIGTGTVARTWSMKIIQYQAGNQMAPDGNCLQYHTASSGTFASFAWNFDTYGPGITGNVGIVPYTQFHLANQHYNICFRREQGKTGICYTPQITGLGNTAATTLTIAGASGAASFGLGATAKSPAAIGAIQQTDGELMLGGGPAAATGNSACQGYTVFAAIGGAQSGARTTGDYLEIPQAFGKAAIAAIPTAASISKINRVCGIVFAAEVTGSLSDIPKTICSKTTPFRVGVHMDGTENMGKTAGVITTFSFAFDNYRDSASLSPRGGWAKSEGHGYSGFYLQYFQA